MKQLKYSTLIIGFIALLSYIIMVSLFVINIEEMSIRETIATIVFPLLISVLVALITSLFFIEESYYSDDLYWYEKKPFETLLY